MIDCFNLETAHLYGDALAEQHRLRHRIFVERLGWEMPSIRRMEYDQYDTPATFYLLWRDKAGQARGVARLNPTDRPYLLRDVFPDFVTNGELPENPNIWEGTRFGVDRELDAETRQRVIGELLLGCLEFGLGMGVRQYLVLMPLLVLKKIFPRMGCSVELVGPCQRMGKDMIAPAYCQVSASILQQVRETTGVTNSVLNISETFDWDKAA